MSVHDRIRVVVDIATTGSTISGELAVDGTPPRCFYGWLELIDALERVATRDSQPRPFVDGAAQPCESCGNDRLGDPIVGP